MKKAQKTESASFFDFVCALFCLALFFGHVKTMLFGGSALALAATAGIGTGLFLRYHKRYAGTLFLPLAIILTLLNLPLLVPAVILWGGFLYVLIGACLVVAITAMFFMPKWRGLFIGIFLFVALFSTTTPLFESGAIGAGCPYNPEILIAAGGTLSEEPQPRQLACGIEPGSVIVSYPKQGKIAMYDVHRGQRYEAAFEPGTLSAMGSGQSVVLAVEGGKGKVTALNVRDLSRLHEFEMGEENCGIYETALADLYLRSLYLCRTKQSLFFADTLRGIVSEKASRVGMMPYRIGINNALERAYVTDLIGSQFSEFDIETMSLLRRINVGMSSSDIVVSSKDHRIFVAMPLEGKVLVYDGVQLEKLRVIPAPKGVTRLALDVKGNRLFAASFASGELTATNLYSPSSPKIHDLGAQVREMVYCPAGDYLFYSTPCAVQYLKADALFN